MTEESSSKGGRGEWIASLLRAVAGRGTAKYQITQESL